MICLLDRHAACVTYAVARVVCIYVYVGHVVACSLWFLCKVARVVAVRWKLDQFVILRGIRVVYSIGIECCF